MMKTQARKAAAVSPTAMGIDEALTLYGNRGSGSAAVEAALAVIGARYKTIDAATWEPGPGLDALTRVNPLAQIPTLVLADGTVLSESAAILIHLGLAYPSSGLLPVDPQARAQALRGLVYIAANCYAAIGVIDYPERWCTDADDAIRQRIVAGARARLHSLWSAFADIFHGERAAPDYLGGPAPGALDLLAAVVSRWSGTRAHLVSARPRFFALLQRVDGAPVIGPVFDRHWPPAA